MSTSQPEPAAPATSQPGASAPRRRTHPITPLVSGWKIVVGIVAVLTAQNIARLLEDFTLQRALIGLGVLAAAVVIAIALSALSWWFTTYAVDEQGVSLHTGMISRSREYAPRARIESVSVERPLLARLLGLAKVRIEVAGGGESYLDIEYVRSADAEELRRGILDVAALSRPTGARDAEAPSAVMQDGGAPGADLHSADLHSADLHSADEYGASGTDPSVPAAPEQAVRPGEPDAHGMPADGAAVVGPGRGSSSASGFHDLLLDGVTDGELIASIPTRRLVHSLLRDVGFLGGVVLSILGVVVAVGLAIWQDGINPAVLIALLPTAIAVPKYVFGRIESGWGFVSRLTDRGLRMRRGLANTRTDNLAPGRIQSLELRRPLLWRGPDWTAVSVTVAGIDDDDENGAENVLPVGTREELEATLGHLVVPLGTTDDAATIEHLLVAPAREIEGLRTRVRLYWISRRTRVSVLLPGALVHRSGIFTRRLQIIPRDRVQQLTVEDGPLSRRLGVLDLEVGGAGDTLTVTDLPREQVLLLHAALALDARTLRRYSDRDHWPRPVLSSGSPAARTGAGADHAPPSHQELR